jgi:hypothetical protein
MMRAAMLIAEAETDSVALTPGKGHSQTLI